LQSARADPKFALPLIRAAALEATQGDWRAALAHSQKAINLNPAAFPNAYALNATANVSLQNADAAEKSAREGLKLDTEHQYAELEYALGICCTARLAGIGQRRTHSNQVCRYYLQAILVSSLIPDCT
jgi:tetratricopeptide (TPR) repeat protein